VTSWSELVAAAPELARLAEEAFTARRMKCLATLRRDGSPRLSETSGVIFVAGDVWLGLIPSAKDRDLARDARASVHVGSPTDEFAASARISGRAMPAGTDDVRRFCEATGRPEIGFLLYRLDLSEVVVTRPHPETGQILVEWWTPQGGPSSATRAGG
jgi:hypothetical protein